MVSTENAPIRTVTTLDACAPVHHGDIIGMGHQIGPPERLHESDIMTAALAAAAEGIDMLLRIINRQVNKPMRICQREHLCRLLEIDPAGRPLRHFFICHIVGIKADFPRVVAPLVFCSAQTVGQGEGS